MVEQLNDLKAILPGIVTTLSEMGYANLFLSKPGDPKGKGRRKPSTERTSKPEAATATALLAQPGDAQNVPSSSRGGPVTPPSRIASGGNRDVIPQDRGQIKDAQSSNEPRSETSEKRPQTFPRQTSRSSNEPVSSTSEARVQTARGQASEIELQPVTSKASPQAELQESLKSPSSGDGQSDRVTSPASSIHNRPSSDNLSTIRRRHIPSSASPAPIADDSNEVTYEAWSLVYGKAPPKEVESGSSEYEITIMKGALTFTVVSKAKVIESYQFIQILLHGLTRDASVLRSSSPASVTQSIRHLPLITQNAINELLKRRSFRKPSVAAVDVGERRLWSRLTGPKGKLPSLMIYLACETGSPLDSHSFRRHHQGSFEREIVRGDGPPPPLDDAPVILQDSSPFAAYRWSGTSQMVPPALPSPAAPPPPPALPSPSSPPRTISPESPRPLFSEEEAQDMLENLLARLDET